MLDQTFRPQILPPPGGDTASFIQLAYGFCQFVQQDILIINYILYCLYSSRNQNKTKSNYEILVQKPKTNVIKTVVKLLQLKNVYVDDMHKVLKSLEDSVIVEKIVNVQVDREPPVLRKLSINQENCVRYTSITIVIMR